MNSEREILKRLFESNKLEEDASILPDKEDKDTIIRGEHHPISTADRPNIDMSESIEDEEDQVLDEKTYTVGDKQYWRRAGKCYCWTSSNGKQECSEEEYMKAISGGSSSNNDVKNTEPKDDKARRNDPGSNYTEYKSSDTSPVVDKIKELNFNDITGNGIDEVVGDYSISAWRYRDHVNIEIFDKDDNVVARYGDIQSNMDMDVAKSSLVRNLRKSEKLKVLTHKLGNLKSGETLEVLDPSRNEVYTFYNNGVFDDSGNTKFGLKVDGEDREDDLTLSYIRSKFGKRYLLNSYKPTDLDNMSRDDLIDTTDHLFSNIGFDKNLKPNKEVKDIMDKYIVAPDDTDRYEGYFKGMSDDSIKDMYKELKDYAIKNNVKIPDSIKKFHGIGSSKTKLGPSKSTAYQKSSGKPAPKSKKPDFPTNVDSLSRIHGISPDDVVEIYIGDHTYEYVHKDDQNKSLGSYNDKTGKLIVIKSAKESRGVDDIADAVGGYDVIDGIIKDTREGYPGIDTDDLVDFTYDHVKDKVSREEWASIIDYVTQPYEEDDWWQ